MLQLITCKTVFNFFCIEANWMSTIKFMTQFISLLHTFRFNYHWGQLKHFAIVLAIGYSEFHSMFSAYKYWPFFLSESVKNWLTFSKVVLKNDVDHLSVENRCFTSLTLLVLLFGLEFCFQYEYTYDVNHLSVENRCITNFWMVLYIKWIFTYFGLEYKNINILTLSE